MEDFYDKEVLELEDETEEYVLDGDDDYYSELSDYDYSDSDEYDDGEE